MKKCPYCAPQKPPGIYLITGRRPNGETLFYRGPEFILQVASAYKFFTLKDAKRKVEEITPKWKGLTLKAELLFRGDVESIVHENAMLTSSGEHGQG